MLDFTEGARFPVVVHHERTGETKRLYYTEPTPSQVIAHRQAMNRRKGGKLILDTATPALKFGKEVLSGFDDCNLRKNDDGTYSPIDGDFAFGLGGKPISSDPGSPNFCAEWKEVIYRLWPVVVETIGNLAFGGTRVDKAESSIEFAGEGVEEEVPPLPRSSTD